MIVRGRLYRSPAAPRDERLYTSLVGGATVTQKAARLGNFLHRHRVKALLNDCVTLIQTAGGPGGAMMTWFRGHLTNNAMTL